LGVLYLLETVSYTKTPSGFNFLPNLIPRFCIASRGFCGAFANRSKTVGKFLNAKTGYKNIFELAGGINYGWIDKGLSTTKTPASDTKPWNLLATSERCN
jgi:hypothetical protein